MFDIMKNSRLYKFLRKIAGDEVSITPVNILEACLDDIADAIGEGGGGLTVLDTFPLTETQIAAVVANPEKYIIKYFHTEGLASYYRIAAIDAVNIYATALYRVNTSANNRVLRDILTISRSTGALTVNELVTGHSDQGVTGLANAAIASKFSTLTAVSFDQSILNLISTLQSNLISTDRIQDTGTFVLPSLSGYRHYLELNDDFVTGAVACYGWVETMEPALHFTVNTPALGVLDFYVEDSQYTGFMYAYPTQS